jgi:hypothetical protein
MNLKWSWTWIKQKERTCGNKLNHVNTIRIAIMENAGKGMEEWEGKPNCCGSFGSEAWLTEAKNWKTSHILFEMMIYIQQSTTAHACNTRNYHRWCTAYQKCVVHNAGILLWSARSSSFKPLEITEVFNGETLIFIMTSFTLDDDDLPSRSWHQGEWVGYALTENSGRWWTFVILNAQYTMVYNHIPHNPWDTGEEGDKRWFSKR